MSQTPYFLLIFVAIITSTQSSGLIFPVQKVGTRGTAKENRQDFQKVEKAFEQNPYYLDYLLRAQDARESVAHVSPYIDKEGAPQFPYEVVHDYDLSVDELMAIMYYSDGRFVRRVKDYYLPQNLEEGGHQLALPHIAFLLNAATHKPKRLELFQAGFTLYFGFRKMDLPIHTTRGDKYVGDSFDGITFYGPWSATTDLQIAKRFTLCDPTKGHVGREWTTDTTHKVSPFAEVIFEIKVPVATQRGDSFGYLPIEDLSIFKWQKERLISDIPGKFIKISHVCYPDLLTLKAFEEQEARKLSDVYQHVFVADFGSFEFLLHHDLCPKQLVLEGLGRDYSFHLVAEEEECFIMMESEEDKKEEEEDQKKKEPHSFPAQPFQSLTVPQLRQITAMKLVFNKALPKPKENPFTFETKDGGVTFVATQRALQREVKRYETAKRETDRLREVGPGFFTAQRIGDNTLNMKPARKRKRTGHIIEKKHQDTRISHDDYPSKHVSYSYSGDTLPQNPWVAFVFPLVIGLGLFAFMFCAICALWQLFCCYFIHAKKTKNNVDENEYENISIFNDV